MMLRALQQLLLAISVLYIAPTDGVVLEWYADQTVIPSVLAASIVPVPSYLPQAADRQAPPPTKTDLSSYGVVTSAMSVLVMDTASNTVLYAKDAADQRPIGSITKLMSALVFLDTDPDLTQSVALLEEDLVVGGRIYLRFNDPLKLENILRASLVGSDNTATMTLVRASGLTTEEFVARMNNKAGELGMTASVFTDPTGIAASNVSTARDVATLLTEIKSYELLEGITTTPTLTLVQQSGTVVNIPSTNVLLDSYLNTGDYQVTTGKTGYIPQAGYCLATSLAKDGHELTIVVLGAAEAEDRFKDVMGLAEWSFKTFTWPQL